MSKNVLITGASRGIGQAAARLFAQNGYGVCIGYYQSEMQARKLVEDIRRAGGDAWAVQSDLSTPEGPKKLAELALSHFSRIDVLINNAGTSEQKLFCDLTDEDWQRMFSLHVGGAVRLIRELLPPMIHRKSGKILNISSMWGQVGASCEVHYSAAKAALIGMSKALAKEVGPSGIQVNCVCPGVIATEMNGALDEETLQALTEETPLMRLGTPLDVAQTLLFLASDAAGFITGQVLGVNGGFII